MAWELSIRSRDQAPRDYTPTRYTPTRYTTTRYKYTRDTDTRYTNTCYTRTRYTTTSSATGTSGSGSPSWRVPTNSFDFGFNGDSWDQNDLNSQTWIYVSEARQQQAGASSGRARPYPSRFGNGEQLPLSTPGSYPRPIQGSEWFHYPLTPGRTTSWTDRGVVPRGDVRRIEYQGRY